MVIKVMTNLGHDNVAKRVLVRVALTSSAYVRWRIVAGGLVLGFFFVLAGAAELTSSVLRAPWPSALR